MAASKGAIRTYASGHRVLQGEPSRGPDFDLSCFIHELGGEHEHVRGLRRAERMSGVGVRDRRGLRT